MIYLISITLGLLVIRLIECMTNSEEELKLWY